jgi:hypothetical protein
MASEQQSPAPAPALKGESNHVKVRTTLPVLPLPDNTIRPTVITQRLLIRPFREDDLLEFHAMRTQPAVMRRTMKGVVDENLDETRTRMVPFLPPRDQSTFTYVMCLKEQPDVYIGSGGCHLFKADYVSATHVHISMLASYSVVKLLELTESAVLADHRLLHQARVLGQRLHDRVRPGLAGALEGFAKTRDRV